MQENIKEFLNILAEYILMVDRDYNLLFANKAMLDLCRLKEEDVINKKCYDFSHQCSQPCANGCIADLICPHDEIFKTGRSVSVTHCHTMPDGTERIFNISASPLRDKNGDVLQIIEILRDVTGTEKIREALLKSEKKLRDITSSLGEGVYVLNEHGLLIFMNPEAERLLGWTEAELVNKKVHDIIHFQKADGTPLPAEDCPVHKVLKTGKRYFSENGFFTKKNGTIFPAACISTPIIENGKIVASVTAFRDITIRKKTEEEILKVQKLKSVAALAGGIAHDFNNLLTVIVGYVSLSKMSLDPESKIFKNLALAESACINAKNLTHQLLAFAKGGEPIKEVVSIIELLRDSATLSLSGSICKCEFSIPDDLWSVEVDEGQFSQVIHNLVVNACEAMPDGGIINIRAENITITPKDTLPLKGERYVRISVEDHGVGIPKEYLENIFDPYFTTKKMDFHKGVGLGLSVCYSIIKNHDGLISVESEMGAGTTFHIYLPAS